VPNTTTSFRSPWRLYPSDVAATSSPTASRVGGMPLPVTVACLSRAYDLLLYVLWSAWARLYAFSFVAMWWRSV
jgi:hypothetical protein